MEETCVLYLKTNVSGSCHDNDIYHLSHDKTCTAQYVAGRNPPTNLRRPFFFGFRHGFWKFFSYNCNRKNKSSSALLALPYDPISRKSSSTTAPSMTKVDLPDRALDNATYLRYIEACSSLREGKRIHLHIFRHFAHVRNPFLLEKLTCFYITHGDTHMAREVFDEIPNPGIFMWNSMIRAYSWNGSLDRAVELYYKMRSLGVVSNKFTFPFVLKACSGLKALEDGTEIHRHAESVGLVSDVFVSTSLIDMYIKCGCLKEARDLFMKMQRKDIVAWNAIVAGHSLHGLYHETISFVLEMQESGCMPNSSTIVSILPVIGQEKLLSQAKCVHGFCVRRGMKKVDVLVGTALLDAYGKCGQVGYAERIFDSMAVKNEVTSSAMIGAYVLCDLLVEALQEFSQIVSNGAENITSTTLACILRTCSKLTDLVRGKMVHGYLVKFGFTSDLIAGNTLLSMYTKCGNVDDSFLFFNEMDSKDTVSYSAIISGCVQNGNAKEALLVFQEMRSSSVEADIATMTGVVPACSHLAALLQGKCTHSCITVLGFSKDTSICNALIDMYAKCGRIDYSRKVFDRIMERDLVSWNSIIMGYGIHGLGKEALLLFSELQSSGSKPDDVTFICLLSACSHSGLVSEGKRWFNAMNEDFGIVPRREHYVCVVDLLGRAGLLDEAQYFVEQMPVEPDIHVWLALLGACRIHRNIELAEEVSRKIQKIGPEGTGNFVLLSNIYSAAGRYDEAANIRIVQKKMGFRKLPGCSWIEVRGVVHAFVGGDQSHPQSSKIHEFLTDLILEMRKLGYHANTDFVLQNVEDEEKEHALLLHSEKLAIAFGIISLAPNQPIFITKNLRVCGDCHSAVKFITLVTKREISVRDASRFHHFKDGLCNCGDFW